MPRVVSETSDTASDDPRPHGRCREASCSSGPWEPRLTKRGPLLLERRGQLADLTEPRCRIDIVSIACEIYG